MKYKKILYITNTKHITKDLRHETGIRLYNKIMYNKTAKRTLSYMKAFFESFWCSSELSACLLREVLSSLPCTFPSVSSMPFQDSSIHSIPMLLPTLNIYSYFTFKYNKSSIALYRPAPKFFLHYTAPNISNKCCV